MTITDEGHGSHWEAIDSNIEEFISKAISVVVKKGTLLGSNTLVLHDDSEQTQNELVSILQYPESPLCYLALIVSETVGERNVLWSFYPFCRDGVVNRMTIDSIHEWENEVEGQLETSIENGADIAFFDPLFALNKTKYQVGKAFDFIISGLAYTLEKIEEQIIEIDSGPMLELEKERALKEDPAADVSSITSISLSMAGACVLLPTEYRDDFSYQVPVEGVKHFTVQDVLFYQIKTTFVRTDEAPLRGYVYASEKVLGKYIPKVGDDIKGVLWLQGYLADKDAAYS